MDVLLLRTPRAKAWLAQVRSADFSSAMWSAEGFKSFLRALRLAAETGFAGEILGVAFPLAAGMREAFADCWAVVASPGGFFLGLAISLFLPSSQANLQCSSTGRSAATINTYAVVKGEHSSVEGIKRRLMRAVDHEREVADRVLRVKFLRLHDAPVCDIDNNANVAEVGAAAVEPAEETRFGRELVRFALRVGFLALAFLAVPRIRAVLAPGQTGDATGLVPAEITLQKAHDRIVDTRFFPSRGVDFVFQKLVLVPREGLRQFLWCFTTFSAWRQGFVSATRLRAKITSANTVTVELTPQMRQVTRDVILPALPLEPGYINMRVVETAMRSIPHWLRAFAVYSHFAMIGGPQRIGRAASTVAAVVGLGAWVRFADVRQNA